MNRIEPEKQDIQSEKNLDDRMELIMYALNDTVAPVPEEGNICTFKYYAKTPNIKYDQHPLDNTPGESWELKSTSFNRKNLMTYCH